MPGMLPLLSLSARRGAARVFGRRTLRTVAAHPSVRTGADVAVPSHTLLDGLRDVAESRPGAEAIVFPGDAHSPAVSLTYAEVVAESDALAASLERAGVQPGHRIGVLLSRNQTVVTLHAALMDVGASFVALDESYPPARVEHAVNVGQLDAIVTDVSARHVVPKSFRGAVMLLATDAGCQAVVPAVGQLLPASAAAMDARRDECVVFFTSGTSGPPKAITLTHPVATATVACWQRGVADVLGARAPATWVCTVHPSFTVAMLELWSCLLAGHRAHITTALRLEQDWFQEVAQVLDAYGEDGGAIAHAVPLVFGGLAGDDVQWRGNPGTTLLSLGDALPATLAQRLLRKHCVLLSEYGLSEIGGVAIHDVTQLDVDAAPSGTAPVPIGHPLPGASMVVVQTGTATLAPPDADGSVTGELLVTSPSLATYESEELRASRFLDSSQLQTEGGAALDVDDHATLYVTGDIVTCTADGVFTVHGRVDDQINLGGLRVEAGEVEQAVEEAFQAVLPPGACPDHIIVVARELDLCATFTGTLSRAECEAAQKHCIDSLPPYHVPTLWVSVGDDMPKTPRNKVDRKQLRAWPLDDAFELLDVPGRANV